MTWIGILLGGAALMAATAAPAQLLGGGGSIGGGLGGSLGGGLGGTMGSVGSTAGGSLRSDALRDAARADRINARALRAEQRRVAAGRGGVSGTVTSGATQATGSGTAQFATGAPRVSSGEARIVSSAGRIERPLRGASYAVRTEAQAGARGLRRFGRSASGVAVYLPVASSAVPVVVAQPYPVYGGGYSGGGGYYGGTDVVVVPDRAYIDRQYNDLRDDTAGTGVTVERRGDDLVLQLPADITFAIDRADIQPRFVAALDAVAQTIAEYRETDVEIIGHTDAAGSDAYNFALSQRRGSSVADFLVSRRAAPDRLIVEAMGETEPVASNATVSGRAANRRVEIVLHPRAA